MNAFTLRTARVHLWQAQSALQLAGGHGYEVIKLVVVVTKTTPSPTPSNNNSLIISTSSREGYEWSLSVCGGTILASQ